MIKSIYSIIRMQQRAATPADRRKISFFLVLEILEWLLVAKQLGRSNAGRALQSPGFPERKTAELLLKMPPLGTSP